MKINFDALKEHLVAALATTALLGASATVVTHEVELGRHDERITRIEELDESMADLGKELSETRLSIAKLEARQEAKDE